ncbi:MAG: NAD(P)-binding protein [Myxococcota bacterium]
MEQVDAIVVGAGFGGIGAALGLAERGARVALFETLDHPGGCASTFTRRGTRYEAGATMFAGLAEGQLLRAVVDRYALPVRLERLDPVLELRWGDGGRLCVPPTRDGLVAALCALPGAPADALRRAFTAQARVADALWALFDDPSLLPPWSAGALWRLARRAPGLLPLAPWVGRPLSAWLAAHGVGDFLPLVRLLRSLCRITVQVDPDEAEAPFALAATDYLFRGIRHVDGGVGELAAALVRRRGAARRHRASALLRAALERVGGRGSCTRARGRSKVPVVVANGAAGAAGARRGGDATPRAAERAGRDRLGRGGVYRRLRGPGAAHHLDLVADPSALHIEGNHVLASVSEVHADGSRTVTASTHSRGGTATSGRRSPRSSGHRTPCGPRRDAGPELCEGARTR